LRTKISCPPAPPQPGIIVLGDHGRILKNNKCCIDFKVIIILRQKNDKMTIKMRQREKMFCVSLYSLHPIITESFVKKYCPKNIDLFHFSIQH